MNYLKIDKTDWSEGIDRLKGSHRVFGPVREQDFHLFKPLQEGDQPDLTCRNTRLSPKAIIYPQSSTLFRFTLDETDPEHHRLKEVPPDETPQAVIGLRPCDAKAFMLVRLNFDTPDIKDPYWIRSQESTAFVGLACHTPCNTCFCTTAGCGPFHEEGLDVLLVDRGEYYLAKVLTEKGRQLTEAAGWQTAAETSDAERDLLEGKTAAEAKITASVPTDRLIEIETTDLYAAPFWEDVAFSCINCGTCTYVCPTCWCFDIQDETQGHTGKRMRNWDSCMYPLFTLHGSGHNPRGTKTHRVRQRFMHKLKYFVDKYDEGIQCVGCGRCIRLCPVNIDIRKVCRLMNGYDAAACELPAS